MKKLVLMVFLACFAASASSATECEKDGKKYKNGAKVGPFTCMPDGKWKR